MQPQRRLSSSGVSAVPSGGGLTFLLQEAEVEDEEDIDNPAKFVTQVQLCEVLIRVGVQSPACLPPIS